MTRVLVDLLFYTGRKGGMESYVREVYSRIADHAPGVEFIGLASSELAAADSSWFPGEVVDSGISGENRAAWAFGELFRVGGFARRLKADLVHCPANFGPMRAGVPVVLTVHDLLPFRHPEYVPGAYSSVVRRMVSLAARQASILTISEASAADITEFLWVPREHIRVIPLAGQGPAAVTSDSRLPSQLLAVGNRMPHKNFELLLEALALIPADARPRLVVTGSHGADPLEATVQRLGLGEWVSLEGWLSDDDLDRLYRESTIVVFPTLFEGFGLPTLEAMSRGCPVICSDIPVLQEVAGDAAVYFDPTDAGALATAVQSLLAEPDRLEELSRLGRARAAEFSWDRTAADTAAALQSAPPSR